MEMAKMTLDLTLDQLIELVSSLSPEAQLRLVEGLLKNIEEQARTQEEEPLELRTTGALTTEQVKEKAHRLIARLRARQYVSGQLTATIEDLFGEYAASEDLTVFTDLNEDDFQA
jgi:C4-type Zn-finger protein